jgi:hypothetical protein
MRRLVPFLIILFSVCGLNSYGAMEYEREESMGYIIPEQALLQVGQTLLKAGVQFAAQGAFQGYEKQAGGLMAAWGKDFLGEATVNVLQQLTTNTAQRRSSMPVELVKYDDGNLVGMALRRGTAGPRVFMVSGPWQAMLAPLPDRPRKASSKAPL